MTQDKEPREANLSKVFMEGDDQGSHVGRRLKRMVQTSERSETPPIPRQVQIETSNICNHSCTFCAYPDMVRPARVMDPVLFRRLVSEAFDLGAREIGLFSGAEPLTCKGLEEHVAFCAALGYEYSYISTNGVLADENRFKRLLDAGLSSIKFSVNAGTRESYRRVHGRDDFDKVIRNIRFVADYRQSIPGFVYLGVSFVATPETAHEFDALKALIGPAIDEFVHVEANNQSGQKLDLPLPPFTDCVLPFNKLHISVEGYIKGCCNDYDNYLAIEDLNHMSLKDAWHGERFRALRRRHLEDTLDGTLCGKCIRHSAVPVEPLNESLLSAPVQLIQLTRRDASLETDPRSR